MKNDENYFWGLDMGTSSVGWAVTDDHYNLIKRKGKDLWGIRLFKEAETAENRRSFRTARRRRQRSVARIGMLQEIFSDAILEIDESFFQRLKESQKHQEDRTYAYKHTIFIDKKYSDLDYYHDFPTIFHLRKALLDSDEPKDVRLVYLVIHNMFKHRGHFLNATGDIDNSESLLTLFDRLKYDLAEGFDIELESDFVTEPIKAVLCKNGISRTRKLEVLSGMLNIQKVKQKRIHELLKALSGLAFRLEIILGESYIEAEKKSKPFSFRDSDVEVKMAGLGLLLDDTGLALVMLLKQIHDQALLENILQGLPSLSHARVESYEKHKRDLALLKRVIKLHCPDQYDSLFRSDEKGSYSAYVGSLNAEKKIRRGMEERSLEALYSSIKRILKYCPNDEDVLSIITEIENERFLPKQLTASNGIIPNQVHLSEMKAILKNAENYLPFLKEVDAQNLSNTDKIIALFSFQIPYYIGPLNDYHADKGGNAWVVRTDRGTVTPWNFEEKIDTKQTAERFIERMVKRCTYMKGSTVLPKASLLYERFMVLNELNNLRIRGEKPTVLLKQEIYNELFVKGKKVSRTRLIDFLISKGIIQTEERDQISGIDGDFKASLTSYGRFYAVLGDDITRDEIQKMVERIIFWGTIYGDDKSFLRENIVEHYREKLTEDQIKRILGFKFREWGRISKDLLVLEGCNKRTGEVTSVIGALWANNENLMEILSDQYTFMDNLLKEIDEISGSIFEFQYDDLEERYLSSPVKRMVWQTILVVKEIETIMGHAPKRIFVEMAREKGEKGKRTTSRKDRLLNLYNACKNESRKWMDEIGDLSESALRSKKLYLYYMQKGRCMYSGEPINLQDLFNDNLYDIDHIYPRHFVKDDSLENNLVLVKKQLNAHKSDHYPIEESIFKSQMSYWRSLLSHDQNDGFITREKYNRLINRSPLTDEQLAGFINRQIVETRQGTKVITQIFERVYPDTDIVFVKAGNISDFRHDFDLLKVRSINDFHHAQDAYLSIVVGNVYLVKFTKNPINFIKYFQRDKQANPYHMSKLFNYNVQRGNEKAWTAEGINAKLSIAIVKKHMAQNTPLITKMRFEGHGKLFHATLYPAKKVKPESYVPLKSSDVAMSDITKYGGYKSVSMAYFFLVEHEVKKNRVRTIETVPIMLSNYFEKNPDALIRYCEDTLGLIKPDIRLPKIKINALIKRNGFFLHITGKSNNQLIVNNAVPLVLRTEWTQYFKRVEKFLELGYDDSELSVEKNTLLYKELVSKHHDSIYKLRPNPIGTVLKNGESEFGNLTISEQCFTLNQVIQISQLSNLGADLVNIKGSKKAGISLISKKIATTDEFHLVNQSITGVFVNEIDLLTI